MDSAQRVWQDDNNQYVRWCFTFWISSTKLPSEYPEIIDVEGNTNRIDLTGGPEEHVLRDRSQMILARIQEDCKYIVAGYEYGNAHREKRDNAHWQGYLELKSRKRLSQLKQYCKGIHWEPAKADWSKNYDYCTKENSPFFFEQGERPVSAGDREVKRWKKARDAAVAGNFDDIDDQIYICHLTNLERVHKINMPKPATLPSNYIVGEWLYGVTGSGKTYDARALAGPDAYLKTPDNWWDHYEPTVHKNVVMEDLSPDHAHLKDLIKVWVDIYPFPAHAKGSIFRFGLRPAKIYITSNFSMEEVFGKCEDFDAIRRRFNVTHYPYKYKVGQPNQKIPEPYNGAPPPPPASVGTFVIETEEDAETVRLDTVVSVIPETPETVNVVEATPDAVARRVNFEGNFSSDIYTPIPLTRSTRVHALRRCDTPAPQMGPEEIMEIDE